jgi:hypothetical protein
LKEFQKDHKKIISEIILNKNKDNSYVKIIEDLLQENFPEY